MLNFYHVAVSKSKVRVKVHLVVDLCPSKMRARMKDARQNFKQILADPCSLQLLMIVRK